MTGPRIALVHDYLTQRGGAERVALLLAKTFPDAPLYTSLYEPVATFPEFADVDVRPLPINRIATLRRNHRLALPVLAPSFSALRIDAHVVICSSSGWAHGAGASARKIVYCYAPARWLYQTERYVNGAGGLGSASSWQERLHRWSKSNAVGLFGPPLRRWDRRAAQTATRYLTSSTAMASLINEVYGIEADVVPPPPAISPDGPQRPIAGLNGGYLLCVARLLAYKNIDVLIEAIRRLPGERLVVVGTGPDRARLESLAGSRVRLLGAVEDDELRWLYANCKALIAASYEDYGLTPLEAGSFGRPSIVLRAGGFLDTVAEAETGLFFDAPDPDAITNSIVDAGNIPWSPEAITSHLARFGESSFVSRLRKAVDDIGV